MIYPLSFQRRTVLSASPTPAKGGEIYRLCRNLYPPLGGTIGTIFLLSVIKHLEKVRAVGTIFFWHYAMAYLRP